MSKEVTESKKPDISFSAFTGAGALTLAAVLGVPLLLGHFFPRVRYDIDSDFRAAAQVNKLDDNDLDRAMSKIVEKFNYHTGDEQKIAYNPETNTVSLIDVEPQP